MPDMHGFEVCRTLRSDARFSATTPIVITTSGPSGRTQRLEAYRAGAWEFLGQPLDGEALLLKLSTYLQCKREVDGLREENLLDPGTGLYNMRGLSRRAREIGAEAFRRRDPIACVVFSPDGEDEDVAGQAEEEMRRMSDQVAVLFRQAGRASDAIGRLGQSEYGVIAPATGPDAAVRMVRRLGGVIEASPIPIRGGEKTLRLKAGYVRCPISRSRRSTRSSCCCGPRPHFATSIARVSRANESEPSSRSLPGSGTRHFHRNALSVGGAQRYSLKCNIM